MITSMEIDGYRLLRDFKADFGDLTVIIGANATGKSSFIECLRSIRLSMDLPISEAVPLVGVLSAQNDSAEVHWRLVLERPKAWAFAPLKQGKQYLYEVRLGLDANHQTLPLHECVGYAEPNVGHSSPFVFLEAKGDWCSVYDHRQKKLLPFDQAFPQKEDQGSGLQRQAGMPKDLADMQKSRRKLRLAEMQFLNDFPELSCIRTLLSWITCFPGFDVSRSSPLRTKAADIRPLTVLELDGGNLGTVLHEILTRADHQSVAEQFKQTMRLAYPFIEDIFAETTYGSPPQVLVRLRERGCNRMMELWDLSDGVLRFMCLLAALLSPNVSPLVLIDEPEAGLHPRLLPILAEVIKVSSESRQVVITTHSPELLGSFSLDEVAVIKRDGNQACWCRPGTRESLRKMLDSVQGDTLADLHRSGELEAVS